MTDRARTAAELRRQIGDLRQRPTTSPASLRAAPLTARSWLYVDSDGSPGLLLVEADESTATLSVRIGSVAVRRAVRCTVESETGLDHLVATVVECAVADLDVQDFFVYVLTVVLDALAEDAGPAGLESALRGVRDLLAASARRTPELVGLWTELLTIAVGRDPERLARAWHVDAVDPFDFLDGPSAIEVKATYGSVRRHRFRSYQLSAPPTALVLSYLLNQDDNGPTVLDLLDEVGPIVGPQRSKVERLVIGAVHHQVATARQVRFNRTLAMASRRGYDGRLVPGLRPPFPPDVTHVAFDAELDSVPPLDAAAQLDRELWRAAWLDRTSD